MNVCCWSGFDQIRVTQCTLGRWHFAKKSVSGFFSAGNQRVRSKQDVPNSGKCPKWLNIIIVMSKNEQFVLNFQKIQNRENFQKTPNLKNDQFFRPLPCVWGVSFWSLYLFCNFRTFLAGREVQNTDFFSKCQRPYPISITCNVKSADFSELKSAKCHEKKRSNRKVKNGASCLCMILKKVRFGQSTSKQKDLKKFPKR